MFYNFFPDDGAVLPETCGRSFLKLNYNMRAFSWF
jgi:hypothetical protein